MTQSAVFLTPPATVCPSATSTTVPITVQLSSAALVAPIVHDLCAAGGDPVGATIRALHAHLHDRFTTAFSDRLLKPLRIKPEPGPDSGGAATLPALIKDGIDYWYTEVSVVTNLGAAPDSIDVLGDNSLQIIPLSYGSGVERAVQLKTVSKKRQENCVLRINHLRVSGALFRSISDSLIDVSRIQPLLANFEPEQSPIGFRLVSYDHMLTGARSFCSCARSAHQSMIAEARRREPSFAPNSWPHKFLALFARPAYLDGICHLCVARAQGPEEATRRYGTRVAKHFESFVDQVQFDTGMDRKTARAEIQQVLGLSRWVREAELYAIVRDLFKDERIEREATPEWLGRMRLDIYLPDRKLAIEHQGEQHYRPIAAFGGEEAHARVVERDALKRQLCRENGVEVIDIRFDTTISKPMLRLRLQRYLRE